MKYYFCVVSMETVRVRGMFSANDGETGVLWALAGWLGPQAQWSVG